MFAFSQYNGIWYALSATSQNMLTFFDIAINNAITSFWICLLLAMGSRMVIGSILPLKWHIISNFRRLLDSCLEFVCVGVGTKEGDKKYGEMERQRPSAPDSGILKVNSECSLRNEMLRGTKKVWGMLTRWKVKHLDYVQTHSWTYYCQK